METTAFLKSNSARYKFYPPTDKFVYCDVEIQSDDSVRGYYLKDSAPSGTSLRAVSTGEKLILATGQMWVSCSLNDAVDVIISYVEIV